MLTSPNEIYLPRFSGSTTRPTLLLRNLCLTLAAGILCGISLGYGVDQAARRGYQHYVQFVDSAWFDENGQTPFRYACDMVGI